MDFPRRPCPSLSLYLSVNSHGRFDTTFVAAAATHTERERERERENESEIAKFMIDFDMYSANWN